MKRISHTDRFKKLYKKLPPEQREKVNKQLYLLSQNHQHPSLKVRKMINQSDIYEARIDLHYRITFNMTANEITLRAVGTHEIYRRP